MTQLILDQKALGVTTFQSMNKLSTQAQLEDLISRYDDEHCFIREAHIISPTYIQKDTKATIAPESRFGLRVFICSPDEELPGLEFVFFEVEQFRVESCQPFRLWGNLSGSSITMGFLRDERPSVVAGICLFKEMGVDCWGAVLKYGYENLFDEGGFAAS